jgi:predicted enzyme related to lactoylglutathione lyase
MEAVDVRGRFMWHQLLTRDVPAAKKFYSSLMAWKTQPWPPDASYTVCHAGDVPAAGMMALPEHVPTDVPPHWLPYIGTRDVDSVAEAAVRAGGSIIKEPAEMKGAGRYALLADPQGAMFAIIDPENARAEVAGTPPLGQFTWHELATSDNEAAFAFYSDLFGWDAITRMDMGPTVGVYLIFGSNGVQMGGMYVKPQDMPAPPNWLSYAHVPDVDEAVATVEAGGGKIVQPPMEVPGGSRITVLMDPSGAAFALHSFPAGEALQETSPQVQARPRPKAKVKIKAKAKAKARAKAKVKPAVRKKASGKVARKKSPPKNAKARTKTKVRVKAKVRTKVKTKAPVRKKSKNARRKK